MNEIISESREIIFMDERERTLQRQRAYRKRRRRLIHRIKLISLLVLFLAVIGTGVGIYSHWVEVEKANAEAELLAQKQARITSVQKKIDTYFSEFIKTTSLETVSSKEQSFGTWLWERCFVKLSESDLEKTLNALENQDIQENILRQYTGESMHVLTDRYLGRITFENQIYERTGKNKSEAEITIAGDLCFAEDGFVLDHYDTVKDLSKCISPHLLETMNQTDIFYINHEYCISDRGAPLNGKYYTFRAKPERMELLKQMGTDLVALANNHVFDYGKDALIDTTKLLQQANIPYVGGGVNIEEAKRPVYFIVNGMKIGFVGASNAEKLRYTPQATEDTPGILRAYDTTEYNAVIQEASKNCDYLIAYIHWGTEDSNYLNSLQQSMGREFLNSGADIVVGGHPHVLQGMEYVDGKPIVYSLGDFWFNSETKYTGLLKLRIDFDGLKEMAFVPALQTNYTTQYIEATEKQRKLFDFLEELSINIKIDDNGIITQK